MECVEVIKKEVGLGKDGGCSVGFMGGIMSCVCYDCTATVKVTSERIL